MKTKFKFCLYGDSKTKKEITTLSYTANELGFNSELISLEDFLNEVSVKDKDYKKEDGPIFVHGPTSITTRVYRNKNWIPSSFHNIEIYKCSNYYSYFNKYLTQKEYCFLNLSELIRRKDWVYKTFAKDDHVFIRPDYGEKAFNGELVAIENFQNFIDFNDLNSLNKTSLCVVSKPETIKQEYRLIILDKKVVSGSLYKDNRNVILENLDNLPNKNRIVEFAEKSLEEIDDSFPPIFVLDIAFDGEDYSVLEFGCISCAGYYESNRHEIIKAINLASIKEYEKTCI